MINIYIYIFLLSLINFSVALYENSDVIDLSPKTFKRVLNSNEIWIVEFYAPWCTHCKAFAPEYSKAATALKGIVFFGAINVDENTELSRQYGIRNYPTVKIFGLSKKSPTEYTGRRTANDLVDSALQEIKKIVNSRLKRKSSSGGEDSKNSDVIELTDSNFNKKVLDGKDVWLVEFYAPWCGHCQRLKPIWERVATELKGKVKVGALDSTVHSTISNKYEIKGFPTIKIFLNGEFEDYNGRRDKEDIISFALDKLDFNAPVPEVKQLIDEKEFKESCDVNQLCIVSILPHILDCDTKCRNNYLDDLKKVAEKFKKNKWAYFWAEALQHSELEESLGLGGFGYPAMTAVNVRKMKYTWLKGSFSFEGISEFLRDLSYGKGSSVPVKGAKIPKIKKIDPWDGKDGKLPENEVSHDDL